MTQDMAARIVDLEMRVEQYTGWPRAVISIDRNMMVVDCGRSDCDTQYTMRYDIVNRREVDGRLSAIGLATRINDIIALSQMS